MGGLHRAHHRLVARANNPFFAGPRADLLSMIPFALLVVLLYLVAREAVLRPKVPE